MPIGEVDLETMASGLITREEIDRPTTPQAGFSRDQKARALQIGRLPDAGSLRIGCRLRDRGNDGQAAA